MRYKSTVPVEMRDRILAATLTVIGRVGIDGVTHRKVAAEAGVGLGSTTRHFASREEMIRAASFPTWTSSSPRLSG